MTAPTPPGSDLDTIVSRTRHLLLDFDGPICSIYAGLPAATVADRLRKLFGDHAQLPGEIARTADPLEVFAYAATVSEDLAARVETEMTGQELAAVATAAPTPYVHEVVTACRNSGRSVAVVSNNSSRAVRSYLARHGLDDRISLVVARTNHDPALLKPSPHLITQAAWGWRAYREQVRAIAPREGLLDRNGELAPRPALEPGKTARPALLRQRRLRPLVPPARTAPQPPAHTPPRPRGDRGRLCLGAVAGDAGELLGAGGGGRP